jgi:hypothetical protein
MISYDAVQREHLKECLYRGELPNLAKIIDEGCIVEMTPTTYSTTSCGHAEMITGYSSEITRVFLNPKTPWMNLNEEPIPKGYTFLERVKEYYGNSTYFSGALVGKSSNVGSKVGEPLFYTRTSLDYWLGDRLRPASEVGSSTTELIKSLKGKPFVLFVHFNEPDHAGHRYGENSEEYTKSIIECDLRLGEIMNTLKQEGIYDSTGIFVTTDHGFMEGIYWHIDEYRVWLATNTYPNLRSGFLVDIVPTIYEYLGIDPTRFSPPMSGTSLTTDFSAWRTLASVPENFVQLPKEWNQTLSNAGDEEEADLTLDEKTPVLSGKKNVTTNVTAKKVAAKIVTKKGTVTPKTTLKKSPKSGQQGLVASIVEPIASGYSSFYQKYTKFKKDWAIY